MLRTVVTAVTRTAPLVPARAAILRSGIRAPAMLRPLSTAAAKPTRPFRRFLGIAAATLTATAVVSTSVVVNADSGEKEQPRKSVRDTVESWKQQYLDNYENRIRELSTPEKVFAYFASVTKGNQKYMTPDDFVRSIIPFQRRTTSKKQRDVDNSFFLLADTDQDGLISFEEYLFFTRLLSTPRDQFELAFRMFDKNTDGVVDHKEFAKVLKAQVRRDEGSRVRNMKGKVASAALLKHFFGEKLNKTLSFAEFASYLEGLQREVLKREFYHYDEDDKGFLSAQQFGLFLVAHARVKDVDSYLARVAELRESQDVKITFDQFVGFNMMLRSLRVLEDAIHMVTKVNGEFDQATLRRAARASSGTHLTDPMLDIIWHVFDTDRNGKLDSSEFLNVMRQARAHSLDRPRDVGFARAVQTIWDCVKGRPSSF